MKPVENMYCDAVLSTPVDFDWSVGYEESWEIIYPDVSGWSIQKCYEYMCDEGVDIPDVNPFVMTREELLDLVKPDEDEEWSPDINEVREEVLDLINDEVVGDILEEWRQIVQDAMYENGDAYSPMMNYFYPLPCYTGDENEDQALLDQEAGAVCLVRVNDRPVLALTGGGMDLSDHIVEAYMLLGYLPPLHFCETTMFAIRPNSERTRWLVEGCLRSCEVAERWARDRGERFRTLREGLTQDSSSPGAGGDHGQ